MSSGNKDSHRRKHRRSPSDEEEAEKSSKRHKNRQHQHRHNHHSHRSKKHDEESKHSEDISSQPAPPPAPMPLANYASRPYDDVEEGEILDDNLSGDNESAEFRSNLEVLRDNHLSENDVGKSSDKNCMENHSKVNIRGDYDAYHDASKEHDVSKEHDAECGRHFQEFRLPSKCSSRHCSDQVDGLEADSRKQNETRKLSSSESSGEGYSKLAHSTLGERYSDHSRDRSRFHDVVSDRYHSQSIGDEEALKKRHHYERDMSRDRRHGSRDLMKDEEREHSVSCSRYDGEDRYGNLDNCGRESREKDGHKDRRREDKERSKDRETDRKRRGEKEGESGEREAGGERWKVKELDRSRDRDLESNQRKEHRMNQDKDIDSNSRREKVCSRSQDREVDMDRRQRKERDRSRDRVGVSDRDRGRRKERDGEWVRERGLERPIGRSKDRSRDAEIDGDRDRYNKFESLKGDRTESHHDRTKKNNIEYMDVGNKQRRDEDEEDFEEGLALKPAEQEEEELNRIIEESRKRKQAILEKYKNQPKMKQNELPSKVQKVDDPVESPGQAVAADATQDDVDIYVVDPSFSVAKSPAGNENIAADKISDAACLGEGTPKSETSGGMFCDDIFGETPTGVCKMDKGDALPVIRSALHDNWDDAEGYYSYRFGELLDGRYEITAAHGKGVFSSVVRTKDLKAGDGDPDEVAIKIIRNNETMHKAGQLEVQILKKLAGADPENKRHCVRFLSSFKYRNHLCLVFESLHMNLREVLKRFGRNIGLSLTAVRTYAKQLFIALKHLKNCGVLHCDLKPDNMLVNEAKNVLKLCDFGNAMFAGKNEITPYLVSRFYRAPEIILGLPYDHPMDIWSVGCCLYELYMGKVLFPGPTNNDMLRLHMELKGPFPKKMLRKGAFTDQHFDQDLNFHATEEDPVTKKTLKRMILNIKQKDIGSIIKSSSSTVEETKVLANFKDLLEKIFVLDPEKRITVAQALAHPFATGK